LVSLCGDPAVMQSPSYEPLSFDPFPFI
jgi:hypothetical protein